MYIDWLLLFMLCIDDVRTLPWSSWNGNTVSLWSCSRDEGKWNTIKLNQANDQLDDLQSTANHDYSYNFALAATITDSIYTATKKATYDETKPKENVQIILESNTAFQNGQKVFCIKDLGSVSERPNESISSSEQQFADHREKEKGN